MERVFDTDIENVSGSIQRRCKLVTYFFINDPLIQFRVPKIEMRENV